MDKKVIWQGGEYRLLVDGTWEAAGSYNPAGEPGDWRGPAAFIQGYFAPVFDELARRLLAERAEQERLDEHNDQAEAGYPVDALGNVERRLIFLEKRDMKRRVDELDKNLAREIEQRTLATQNQSSSLRWDRTQGIMVDGNDKIALDLSDYFEEGNMSKRDHDLLEKLAALWNAWGEGGYLRDRLALAGPDARSSGGPEWFRQLRSELLAKPWKEGV